jgi:hypothetical protein
LAEVVSTDALALTAVPAKDRESAFNVDVTGVEPDKTVESTGVYASVKWHTPPAERAVVQSPDFTTLDGNEPKLKGATALPSFEMVYVCEAD